MSRTYIVAELGLAHMGSRYTMLKLIEACKAAGVNAVKFQYYKTEDFLQDRDLKWHTPSKVYNQWTMFKQCEIKPDQMQEYAQFCKEIGVEFGITPTSVQYVRDCKHFEACFLKNGSDFLRNRDVISAMGETKLWTVLSTGMANSADIHLAERIFREAGGLRPTLAHCTSAYPCPPHDVHLSRIRTLKQMFGATCTYGFSDHTNWWSAAAAAVSYGISYYEHHVCDRQVESPDNHFSCSPTELHTMVDIIRTVELMQGSPFIKPSESEAELIAQVRTRGYYNDIPS